MLSSFFFNVDRDMNFVGHLINFYDASHPFFFFFLEKQISPEWTRKKGCFFCNLYFFRIDCNAYNFIKHFVSEFKQFTVVVFLM